jgi:hypothetical protein
MATIQLLTATVKHPALEPKDFGHGLKINVVFATGDQEIKIWGKPNDAIAHLKKGEKVSLLYNGKSYKLAQPSAAATTAPQNGDYVTRLGQATANYEQAWNAAAALLKRKTGLSPETTPGATGIIRSIAADLFRAAG